MTRFTPWSYEDCACAEEERLPLSRRAWSEACIPLSRDSTKMTTKLQEFVAHGSAVNCLQFGRKSGAVMVTGGEDKKVNVWAIGRPNAILSLTGHTSSVECVTFDSNESTVIAGSAGGTLKLWDLEQAKVARTLTGHRSNCISVQVYSDSEQCLLLAVVQRAFHVSQGRLVTADRVRVCALPTVASLRRILCLGLCRHQSQDLGYSAQVVHSDVQGPHPRCAADRLLSRWALGRLGRRRWCGQAVGSHGGQVSAMPTLMSAPVLLSTISPASRICAGSCMNSPRTLRPYRALRCTRRNS